MNISAVKELLAWHLVEGGEAIGKPQFRMAAEPSRKVG